LTECGDLSEAEVEETEMVVVAVKTVKVIETAAVTITTAAVLKMAATVMTTAKTVAVVVTDEKGDGRRHIGGNSGA
jgi:hypothetical protein